MLTQRICRLNLRWISSSKNGRTGNPVSRIPPLLSQVWSREPDLSLQAHRTEKRPITPEMELVRTALLVRAMTTRSL